MPCRSRAVMGSPPCGRRPVDTQAITLFTSPMASSARRVSLYTSSEKNSSGNPSSIVRQGLHPGKLQPQEGLDHGEAVCLQQGRVPVQDLLHPAGHGAVEAVIPAVPEVVLGEDVVEVLRHLAKFVPGQ